MINYMHIRLFVSFPTNDQKPKTFLFAKTNPRDRFLNIYFLNTNRYMYSVAK